MMPFRLKNQIAAAAAATTVLLFIVGSVSAQQRTPLEEFVNGFPLDLAERAMNTDMPTLLKGGDETVYFAMNAGELLRTSPLPVRQRTMPLAENPMPGIGKIKAKTIGFGTLTLDEFLAKPETYTQACIVIHRGKVVYEKYPRMRPKDYHVWMSNSKTLASLVIDLLISEGKIDENQTMGTYVPEFRGSAWENIRVKDVLDMTPGLNSEENAETRSDPNSIAIRSFLAEFGMPFQGKREKLLDVLRDAKRVNKPGEKFEYGSPTTETLVFLAEAVENKRWPRIFEERVWSKVGAEAPLLIHTTPDGIAAVHGLVSSTLRDMARFGMLYTPSWSKIASEQVVTPVIIERIRKGVRSHEFYLKGYDGPLMMDNLNDHTVISNSRQWDAVWPDGDMWKSGLMGQGLYISPSRDLVFVYLSINALDRSFDRYVRPLATSGLFDN